MSTIEQYIQEIERLIAAVKETQTEAIEQAAVLCADALCRDGFLFTFGTGHSHMLAEEIFYRAGGLARVCPMARFASASAAAATAQNAQSRTASPAARPKTRLLRLKRTALTYPPRLQGPR